MALGFNHGGAPNWDHSNIILSDRSGENYANAIRQAAGAISQGITQYGQMAEQNREFTARSRALENLIKTHPEMMGGEEPTKQLLESLNNPDVSPRNRYQALNDAMQGAQVAAVMQRAEEQRAAKADEERRRIASDAAMAEALRDRPGMVDERGGMTMLRPETVDANERFNAMQPAERYMDMVGQSGAPFDERAFNALTNLERVRGMRNAKPQLMPGQEIALPGGRTGYWTGAQVKEADVGKPEDKPLPQPEYSTDGKYFRSSSAGEWKPVRPDRPVAPDPMLKYSDPELYAAMRADYVARTGGDKAAKETDSPMVEMIAPDGRRGRIPAAKVEEAIKRGFKRG